MNHGLHLFLMKNLLGIILLEIALTAYNGLTHSWAQEMETYSNRSAARSMFIFPISPQTDFPAGSGKGFIQPLTLEACVRIALDKNPLIRAVQEGVAAAREGIGEARAPYYPELGLNAGYSHWQKYAFLPSGIARPGISPVIGPTDDWAAGLRARYTIFDGGERRAKLGAAHAGKGFAEEESARVRLDVVLDIHYSYYSLLSALEIQAVAGKQLARAEDHLRLARERKAAGVVPLVDVLRAQVGVGDAKLALVRAENLMRIASGNLCTSMGLPVETLLQVEAGAVEIKSPGDIDIAQAFSQAVHSRPELRASLQRLKVAQSSIDGAKSAYGPKIRAEGGYGWRDKDFLPQEEEWLVGVTIDLPLFTGFSRKHRLAKAKAEMSKEEAERERVIQKVRQEVWSAHSKLQETFEATRSAEILVKDALESHRLAQERYKVGAGTLTDLLDTQAALDRAEGNRVAAHWDHHIARSVFNRATGSLPSGSIKGETR